MSKGFNKPRKSIMKRIKVTGTGKLKAKKVQGRSHLMSSKSPKKKRQMKHQPIMGKGVTYKMRRMMGI